MSIKKSKLVSYLLTVVLLTGCILFAGCSHIFSGKSKHTYTVPEEKLQQIDTLELTEAKDVKELKDAEEEKPVSKHKEIIAPAKMTLSIEECRALALENNLDLKVKLIDPAIAAETLSEAEAKYEATFSVNAIYQQTNTPVAGYLDEVSGIAHTYGFNLRYLKL